MIRWQRRERLVVVRSFGQHHSAMVERCAISLFSGAGGLDLGVEQAGYRILAALEFDSDACDSLRANFPHASVLQADIRRTSTDEVLRAASVRAGEVDLLI